jgi:hypothetical protein
MNTAKMVVTLYARWLASPQMTMTPMQYSKAQRRLLTTLGGLGVAALAAGAFVLSYDDLRSLALRGGASRHWAFLYPGMIDGLVVVIILAIVTARRSGWGSRALRWLLLLALIAGAGAAGIQRAVKGYAVLPDTWVKVGVAAAPWAILILAVWLWIAMIKQVRSLRTPPSRSAEPAEPTEPVPATVVDKSIVPGLDADTRPLPRPASLQELEPVRAPEPPQPNPWDVARLKAPEPWEEDTDPTEPAPSPSGGVRPEDAAGWEGGEGAENGAEPFHAAAPTSFGTAYAEQGDTVPPSWRDEAPQAGESGPASTDEEPESPRVAEPEPLLPPTPRRAEFDLEKPWGRAEPEHDATEPEPKVEAPVNDRPAQPADDEPTHRLVARTSLPTDVRLVGGPEAGPSLADTQPDGIPIMTRADDDEDGTYTDERAEDPDAGMESTPPSSKFWSSPTPPRD